LVDALFGSEAGEDADGAVLAELAAAFRPWGVTWVE
jgi:hypothetical protein